MEKVKVGDIVFVDNGSILSRVIQIVTTGSLTKKVPSHVAVVTGICSNAIIVVEATLKGVIISNMDKYSPKILYIKRMQGERDIPKGLAWLNAQIGLRYDFAQLWGIFARTFWRLFGEKVYNRSKRIRNFLDSKQRMICSEIVEMFASITGNRLWWGDIGFVTPYDLSRSEELKDVNWR